MPLVDHDLLVFIQGKYTRLFFFFKEYLYLIISNFIYPITKMCGLIIMDTNLVSDATLSTFEELVLGDLQYIDSRYFDSKSSYKVLNDYVFKYIDHLILNRRPSDNEYVLQINNINTVPSYRVSDIIKGANYLL